MNSSSIRALVTGGGGGIGGAIADELLARGAAVLLVDRDEAPVLLAQRIDLGAVSDTDPPSRLDRTQRRQHHLRPEFAQQPGQPDVGRPETVPPL